MSQLPEKIKALLVKPVFAHFSTLRSDGSPSATPVWIDVEGDKILVNSVLGRAKDKNVHRDPRVAISLIDPDNAYAPVAIRGRVVEITTDGAEAHIDKLAKKYLGKDTYPYRQPGQQRVLYKIEASKVS